MSFKVALTLQDGQNVSGHAGHCQQFVIYTIDDAGQYTKEDLTLSEEQSLHNALHDTSNPDHPLFNVDMLLVESIGAGAIHKLAHKRVAAHIIREKNPETAIQLLINGTLEAYAPQGSHSHGGCGCGSHGHHEDEHAHAHEGCGCGSHDHEEHTHEGCGCHSDVEEHDHHEHGGCGCGHHH